ncbi:hypothetical protein DNHGIG_00680 [Collibacillus ludicampi]|uniref:Uncharacterized protein n=1 Tax=Collibacillus ludicampi TaxID=2771369 RepID=A0AAV4L9M9_9BACL|nr:hypothetical protein [Collibacillus ludicampi]GIM44519.1 hypothetical protein DNHGIG_00680 [Collibacillus ludicampi]
MSNIRFNQIEEQFKQLEKQMAYYEYCRQKTIEDLERRKKAFKDPECQKIYHQLIEYCGGEKVVRPGIRGRAKQLAINCFLKNPP